MTISSSYSPDTYSGTGSLDTFAITFSFLSDGDNVKVSIKNSAGTITVKTAATHYNVTGSNVVFTTGNIPAATDTVIIELNPDFQQNTDYTENGNFPAQTHETALDKLTLEAQINNDLIARAIRVDATVDLSTSDWTLPDAVASGIISFNATADGLAVVDLTDTSLITLPVSVANGGTGATTAAGALSALGAGTEDSPTFTGLTLSGANLSTSNLSNTSSGLELGGSGARVTTILDEDTLSTDSATALATQQSIKAYVDTQVGAISGIDEVARDNIALIAFRSAIAEGYSVLSMEDGIVDEFEDQTGVDDATSTGETYDATNDFYTNAPAGAISSATGTIIGDMTAGGGTAAAFDDTTSQTAAASASTTSTTTGFVGKDWGSGNDKTITQVDIYGSTDERFATAGVNITLKVQGSTDNFSSSIVDLYSFATFVDNSAPADPQTIDGDGGLTTTTAYRYHRVLVEASGSSNLHVAEVVFYEQAASTLSLVSESTTAEVEPSEAKVILFEEDVVGTATLNTDLIAAVSRDGGTTFTNATLVDQGDYDTGKRILSATVDISGQPSGTSMQWKVTTANDKGVNLHGVALEWRT